MKILVFLHGTTIMHKNAIGCTREERVKQVINKEKSVYDYSSYVPIGNAVGKLKIWKKQGIEILYLSSHKTIENVKKDKSVLKKHYSPDGQVLFRKNKEKYKEIIEKIMPDIIIEDDCESIGGKKEMVITKVNPKLKKRIKSIIVREFEGLDKLPDKISDLFEYES